MSNESILIKKAKVNDFLEIASLDREAWGNNNHSTFIPDGEHVWRIWAEHAIVLCATQNNDLRGVILAFPSIDGSYCVHKVFVKKEYREQGIGSKLFNALLEEIDKLKVTTFLTVDPDNQTAIALYKKWGYNKSTFVKGFYRPEEDRFVLSRVIN